MRVSELRRKAGTTELTVWPPPVATASFGAGDTMPYPGEGVLKGVRQIDDRLSITFVFDGRDHMASVQWDGPPALDEVEQTLRAQIGKPMKDVGAAEIVSRAGQRPR